MLKSFALAVTVGLLATTAATAQDAPPPPSQQTGFGSQSPLSDPVEAEVRAVTPTRRQAPARTTAPAAPTPEEIAAAVAPLAAVAVPQCRVTESALLGSREDGTKLYEVACASGPGYVIEAAATGPKANDCVLQWSFAETQRERDPAADVGLQCGLPGNQNAVQVISAYGAEAGVNCQVDKAVATAVGIYEIGCADRDGWTLERTAGAWDVTPCWELALTTNATCRYSTTDEAKGQWAQLVVGTDAAACQIEDIAWMGDNPERGAFYELKCTGGEGIIVRFKDGAGQQTYSCIDAPQIFNKPCSLTTTAPAAAPATTGGRV